MTIYTIRLQPRSLVEQLPEADWMYLLDADDNGVHIPITGNVPDSDPGFSSQGAIIAALTRFSVLMRSTTDAQTPWDLGTDAGLSAISEPQLGNPTDKGTPWYINLCCSQGTLGQIATFIYNTPDLAAFAPSLFPRLSRTSSYDPSAENLGAWQVELNPWALSPPLTQAEANAARARVIEEAGPWTLCLLSAPAPGPPLSIVWPSAAQVTADPTLGLLYKPDLTILPPSIYPRPPGSTCWPMPCASKGSSCVGGKPVVGKR